MAFEPRSGALLTDLYELTMAAACHANHWTGQVAFELFVRGLPPDRSYFVAAGLAPALEYLSALRFEPDEIEYLRGLDVFAATPPSFWEYLRALRFTGQVDAMPEGTVFFPDEPILTVTAPMIEAQIVETFLLTLIGYQTLVATKAARVCRAAALDGRERPVVDFGTRRAHGPGAGVLAARASFIGGCAGTSNVLAGRELGIPVFGTQAHSFIMARDDEREAFRAYYEAFPESATLLIDTYDTERGARRAVEAAPGLKGVRIDSGDLGASARRVREILDQAGCRKARIILSGDLNEFRIRDLVAAGVPVDAFGVGTEMVTSKDAPALPAVYKLVAVEKDGVWHPRMKLSEDKANLPGAKQVYRFRDGPAGPYARDRIAEAGEEPPAGGEPLLERWMTAGRAVRPGPPLGEIQARARRQLSALPKACHEPEGRHPLPVDLSGKLRETIKRLREEKEALR